MNILFLLQSRLSDDEIVERTRKRLNANWKFRVFLLIASLACASFAIWETPTMVKWVTDGLAESGAQWRWFYIGVSTGVGIGMMLFVSGFMATIFFVTALVPTLLKRRDCLLVHYYDELQRKRS